MPLDEIFDAIDRFEDEVIDALADATEAVAAGYIPSLLRRVQSGNKTTDGKRFGTYANSTSAYKRKKGQPSQYINLTDTFSMLSSIDLRRNEKTDRGIIFEIAPDARDRGSVTNRELMAIHEKRFGDIMAPNEEELEVMQEVFAQVINDRLRDLF